MNDSQVSKRSLPLLSILQGDLSPQFLQTETLADIFRETVRNVPQKTALIFQNQSLNYSELDQWSDQIAIQLNHHGIKPGDTVGIWWPRSLELHVIILGIIKSGAAYVPLDFEMPQDRVETVLKEVQAKTYFSPQKLSLSILSMQPCSFAAAELKNQVLPKTDPEGWAYVLYTSGSTGKPKGIPITHRQICHFIRAEQSVLKIQASDRVYQGFSVSFDMWCEETFISYLVGATLWIADSTTAKSLDALSEILKKNEITVLHAVPSLLAVIDEVSSIRLVNAGGEACTPPVLERWGTASREFFNTYGPTETTVSASIAKLKKGDSITIGFPLPNYGFAVVDEALNPLPRGVAGELVISGPGVGSGYVNRAELSLEKFISKPTSLSVLSGDKIYRTGDAAIMNEQGEVLLSGRLDDQIKLRGYRIELGEIESQLNAIDSISMAAVTLKKDTQNQDHLVAYLILKTTENLSEFQLRAHLTEHLPPYMIPSEFVFLKEMPRLPSGKIDRKALPIPERLKQNITDDFEKISSSASLSEKVTFLLKKMFPQNFQDLSQDFFNDLGGHSLLAAEFVSRLRHQANMGQVSIQEVYTYRPLQKLVEVWNQKKASQNQAPDFHEVSKWRYYLCSLGQSLALLLIYGLFAAQIFFPYLAYYYVLQDTSNHFWGFIAAILSFCFVPPLFSALTIASKWLIIGRMKEGDYPLWGSYYFRWWLVKTIQKLTPLEYVNGTPLYPLYYRMMGAK
ncbi:MAG: amino acid adenylation domain-containing protein, partial [Deltaproteobacteria bacterium]|nr:amino acid adenylation domain-containing protein [Deltaproteobacteria bacterium]